jgi:hypothetical protein
MRRLSLVLAGLLAPACLAAQLPDPATRALGMGGAYTSLARGYEAIFWNPAMLATAGNKSFTIGLPHLVLEVGSNTYGSGDFRRYAGEYLSDAEKQELLDKISEDDSVLTLRWLGGVTPFGITIGRFGLAVAAAGDFDISVGPDAIELALFGNARRSGPGEFFTASGSGGKGWGATTVAGSLGWPFRLPMGRVAVGVTYKHIIGNFIARAEEIDSRFQVNPSFNANATGHAIYTDYSDQPEASELFGDAKAGSGFGVDVGVTWQPAGRSFTLSAVMINALGSMEWDSDRLVYERAADSISQDAGGAVRDTAVTVQHLTPAAIEADPIARDLRDRMLDQGNFARVLRVGVALRKGMLTLSGGGHLRLTEGLDRQPSRLISGGAELNLLSVLRLRAGAATNIGSTLMISGGAGLNLLGINIDASAAHIGGSERPGVVVGLGVGLMW